MPVYIKKYSGSNYFESRNFVDALTLTKLPEAAFPIFRYETEDFSSVGVYRGGDFDLVVDLSSSEISDSGSSIKDFFLGVERDYYYLVIIVIGTQTFSGVAQQSQVSADFTYTEGRLEIRIICKDILHEWANRCSSVAVSTVNLPAGARKTFEEYIYLHFAGITSDVLLIGLPSVSYLQRLQPYGTPAGVWAYGDFFQFITNKQNISRWETFKELALGIGFNFELYLNPGTELTSAPEFIFNIFFIDDLVNETPITTDIIEHREFTTASRLEYLFLKYRSVVLSGIDYSNGIFFNNVAEYYSDADNSQEDLYPCCLLSLNDKVLSLTDINGNAVITLLRDVDFIELPLNMYSYDFLPGIGIGKLYPLDEAEGGGMAYSKIFNAATGSGTNIDLYNHNPIQRYAIQNYKRYLKGLQKAKNLVIPFNINSNVKTWQVIQLNDGSGDENYYISAINTVDIKNNKIEIECIKLIN